MTFDDGPNFGTETVLDAFKKVKHGYVPFSSYNANYISPSILSSHITKKLTVYGEHFGVLANIVEKMLFCFVVFSKSHK